MLAVGDVGFQKKCLGKMGEVAKGGKTILFVSHNLSSISSLCPSCMLLYNGQIVFYGDTNEAIDSYLRLIEMNQKMLIGKIDRIGTGEIKITKVSLEDSDGGIVDVVESGQKLNISLEFDSEHRQIDYVQMAIIIHNRMGEFMFICRTDFVNDEFTISPDIQKVVCEIPKLPLQPGHYSVSLWVRVNGYLADKVEHAKIIKVAPGKFYNTGRLPPRKRRGVLVDHVWRTE